MLTERQPLFSEAQVNALVKAEVAKYIAESLLNDSPPQTIIVDIRRTIQTFQEMEQEVRKKHQEALKAWRKAYSLYADYLKKNPGGQILSPPGSKPSMSSQLEIIRKSIRSYEVLTVKQTKLPFNQWSNLFTDATKAVSEMRKARDEYVAYTSGVITNLATNLAISPKTFVG